MQLKIIEANIEEDKDPAVTFIKERKKERKAESKKEIQMQKTSLSLSILCTIRGNFSFWSSRSKKERKKTKVEKNQKDIQMHNIRNMLPHCYAAIMENWS